MPRYTPIETTNWVAENLKKSDDVDEIKVLSDQVLQVFRGDKSPYVAGVVSQFRVDAEHIEPILALNLDVEIIVNVPKESFWTGAALNLAAVNKVATGSYGDLLRVLNWNEVREFRSDETNFVERGLRQHSCVKSFERIHDRLYRVERNNLPNLTVVMLNEYELTADAIRTARDRYGAFSVVARTNPNGRVIRGADEVAETLGAEIFDWGGFFRRLRRE